MFKRVKLGLSLAQSGEWPSDDENDETFTVDGEVDAAPKVKRKRTQPIERKELSEKKRVSHSDWGRLPRPVIAQIARHMIRESGDFLRVQRCLALNRHWYDCSNEARLETHLALYVRNKAHSLHSGRGTRSSFEKLRALLGSFDGESGLQNVRHLKFTNFHNHMNKTLDILSAKRFELDSLTVQTTTVGSNAAWEKFVTVHCGQMSSVHLNAVRLNVKSLSLALSLTTLTEVRLIDVGPLGRSIAWGALKELRILDIFFASKTAESMNSVFMLSKLSCLSHLTRLQLANISLDERNLEQATTASAGFNKLERISLRRSFAAQNSYTNNVLFFLLKNAVKLRSLDLQGCSTFDLADIWVTLGPLLNRPNLKELDISQCNAKYGLGDMFVECADIKPNLSKLIMSNLKGMETSHFDGFILSFVNGNMNLTALDITRTPISDRQILQIITGRNGIEELDLTGCYSAPRGWRRLVRREEFDKLIRIVQQLQ